METKINMDKLTKLDIELLEKHNEQIPIIGAGKKQEIHIFMENEIRNLYNLINDPYFIEEKRERGSYTAQRLIYEMLNLYQDSEYIELSEKIDSFIDSVTIHLAVKRFKNTVKDIKKDYLRELNRFLNIKTEF